MKELRKIFIVIFFVTFCYFLSNAQDSIPKYYADVEFIFRGQVMNQYDSVFQVYYLLDLEDMRYNIKEVMLKGGDIINSNDIIQGNVQQCERSGDKIRMNVGEHGVTNPIVGLKYFDEQGNEYKVILRAPFGELGDLEEIAFPEDTITEPNDSLYQTQ